MRLKFNWDTKPLYDVIVRIPGSEYPDEWIIRGNHHDALGQRRCRIRVSGAVAEMEEMRGLSELLKQGWKPKRTIIYCFWDGEEPGLLGSTEWAETHAADLEKHAVVYINSDGNGRGFLNVAGLAHARKFHERRDEGYSGSRKPKCPCGSAVSSRAIVGIPGGS